jgi:hypothetical protein
MDAEAILQAVTINQAWRDEMQAEWLAVMELAVWGEVKSSRLGAMNRVRRRVLEVGEKLHSLCASRIWIPHPREQLKNALGSSFSLKDSLAQLIKSTADADGGADGQRFAEQLARLQVAIESQLPALENRWAEWLDTQYVDDIEDEDEPANV